MTDKVRVGVIGVGRWGRLHAQKFASMEGVELVGVVDVVRERADEVAASLRTSPFYDHKQLLGKVDAVSIVTPTSSHFAIAWDFLKADVNVFLEKPMTDSLEKAFELQNLAENKGLLLQIGHLERFNGALSELHVKIDPPERVVAYRLSPFPDGTIDTDVVLDLMIHDIDLVFHLLGGEVVSIEAEGKRLKTVYADVAKARLFTEKGIQVELHASRVAERKIRKMILRGQDSRIVFDFLNHRYTFRENGSVKKGGKVRDSLFEELHAFVESVRKNLPPVVNAQDGIKALEVALRISGLLKSRWE